MSAGQDLAAEIVGTWPLGPAIGIWTRTIEAKFLDLELAWQTYRHLRDTHHGRDMTIPAFADAYRAERKRQRRNNHHHHEPAQPCAKGVNCDGWTTQQIEHNGHAYAVAEPCCCHNGRANQALANSIVEHNAEALDRILGAGRHHRQPDTQPDTAA